MTRYNLPWVFIRKNNDELSDDVSNVLCPLAPRLFSYAVGMIENRHFRYFLEVAETLHITRAAERLHIAQPALTQNIQQLEEELGVKLLRREGQRFSLTEAGRVLKEEADLSLKTFYKAQLAAKRAERGEVGKIVIGFQSTAGFGLMPQLFKNLRDRYPGIVTSLRELGADDQKRALRQAEIDVAIAYALPDSDFGCHELPAERALIALPLNHPLAKKSEIGLKDIAQEIFVIPSIEVAEIVFRALLTECAEHGFQPEIQEVSTSATALGLISVGYGVGIVPESVTHIGRPGVVFRAIRDGKLSPRLRIMWLAKNPSPIVPKILECLEEKS
jgi:DNA-binding transcriptional LysR family regulator